MSLNITAFLLSESDKKTRFIAIAGSRFKYFKHFEIGVQLCYELIKKILTQEKEKHEEIILIHGGNWRSVDYIANHVAKELGIETMIIDPRSWNPNDLRERTRKVVQGCDVLYCIFVDSITAGTYLAYKIGHELKKEVHAYKIDTEKREIKKIRLKIKEK